jgi:chromosome segregation ATPase
MNFIAMGDIKITVDALENKINKVLEKIKNLELVNQDLSTKITDYENIISQKNQEMDHLKSNNNALKIANSLLGSDDYKRDTKLKINSLIKEIDYCIAQLSD